MTITQITSSCRISGGKIVAYKDSTKTNHTDEVLKKQRIELAYPIILKKQENSPQKANRSPEKLNRQYTVPENCPHPYLMQYTQYKNASDDAEREKLLSSFEKDIQLYIVIKIPSAIQYLPPFVQEDVEFVLSAVKKNGLILEYLSDVFKGDTQIIFAAFYQNPHSLRHACFETTTICNNGVLFSILHQEGLALQYASDLIKDDKAKVLTAIGQNRTAFVYASERLRKDQEIIDAASEPSIRSIEDIPENMREDKETLLKLLRENGLEFEHIPEKYKTDLDIVLTALRQNYHVFEYLSHDLQNNSSVIKIAIWQDYRLLKYLNKENAQPHIISNGLLIQYLADSLKDDKSLAILALQQNKEAFQYLNSSLQNDPEIIEIYRQPDIDFPNALIEIRSNKITALEAVRRNGLFLKYVDSKIQDDFTLVSAAIAQNPVAFQYAKRPRILKSLQKCGCLLKYAGGLRGDSKLVEAAVRQNGLAFRFARFPARNQVGIIQHAILQNPLAFQFLPDNMKNNQQFVVTSLKLDPSLIQLISKEMSADRQFILEAVKTNGMVLKYLQKWLGDEEIIHEAIKQNRWAIEFAPDGIRTDQKYREEIERKPHLKYDKQIIFDLVCKTTAVALTLKAGAVAGRVPTKIVPIETEDPLGQMNFSENLSYKSRIYLIGHCRPGRNWFSSDNGLIVTVEKAAAIIKEFFKNTEIQNGQKVTVSLIGCYSGMSSDTNTSFAEKLSVRLDEAKIPAEVIGRRAVVRRAQIAQIRQYKKMVDESHQEPGMTVVFSTEDGKTTMQHRYLDDLFITQDVVTFPNFGTLFKNLSHYEIDLSVDGQDEILKQVHSIFQAHRNSAKATVGMGQWFVGKHPIIKNQKTIWFTSSLGDIDYARGGFDPYLQDNGRGVGDFDVYVLAHYLKKCELKPENAIV